MVDSLYEVEPAITKERYMEGQSQVVLPPGSNYDNRPNQADLRSVIHESREDWQYSAACKDQYDVMWEKPGETRPDKADRERLAKRICASCKVIDQCLETAIRRGESAAVWGGLNDDERKKLAKRKRVS